MGKKFNKKKMFLLTSIVIFFMVEANCPDNEPSGLDETGIGSLKEFLEDLYFNGPPEAGAGYYKRSDGRSINKRQSHISQLDRLYLNALQSAAANGLTEKALPDQVQLPFLF